MKKLVAKFYFFEYLKLFLIKNKRGKNKKNLNP